MFSVKLMGSWTDLVIVDESLREAVKVGKIFLNNLIQNLFLKVL